MSTFKTQIGGTHYKGFAIDPARFCIENGLGFAEGSAVKYVCRWKLKGGLEDLRKAKHYIDMLLEINEPEPTKEMPEPLLDAIKRKCHVVHKGTLWPEPEEDHDDTDYWPKV